MTRLRRLAGALLVAPLALAAGDAPPPSRIDGEEISLRLVAEAPRPDGTARAALLLDLEPGWKTYWLDPGDAGIPPVLDLSASVDLVALETGFPVPHRFADAYGSSNGFSQPLAIALTLRVADPAAPARLDVHATLGVCREVCVPVEARLSAALGEEGAPGDRLVASAFAALPSPSTPGAGILAAALSPDGGSVEVTAKAAPGEDARNADLFLSGPKGWFFGAPKPPRREKDRLVFVVPVSERPKAEARPVAIDAVLVLGASAYGETALPVADAP